MDKKWRTPGRDWFANETASWTELESACQAPADVVVAHDAPANWTLQDRNSTTADKWPADALRESDAHQQALLEVADATGAKLWLHGHHHWRYSTDTVLSGGRLRIEGLACDDTPPSGGLALLIDARAPVTETD